MNGTSIINTCASAAGPVVSAAVAPPSAAELGRRIVDLVRGASTEITPQEEKLIPVIASNLRAGTTVYVAHTPKATLDDVVRVALRLEAHGLRASPHLVARRIESERALRQAVRDLANGGVGQVLIVAGDTSRPGHPFSHSLQILETGVLQEAGIRRVGIAGHPDGHNGVDSATLWQALKDKRALAVRDGLAMHIVTQFGFDPGTIHAWAGRVAGPEIALPVHVGVAGPAPLSQLVRYAMACGVAASLRGLAHNAHMMRKVSGLAAHADEMLIALARGSGNGPRHIHGIHLFAFGGAVASTRWLRAVTDGNFRLSPAQDRFETL